MSRGRARAPASKRRPKTGSGSGGKSPALSAPGLLGAGPALGNQAFGNLLDPESSLLDLGGSKVPPPVVSRLAGAIAVTVYFAKNQFVLDTANLEAVQSLAGELPFLADARIIVDGHASQEGKDAHNQGLSERRRLLVTALLGQDLDPEPTFGGDAKGENEPASEETGKGAELEANRARNRRVEIYVLHKAPAAPPKEEEKKKLNLFPRIPFEPETPSEKFDRQLRTPMPPPVRRERRSLKDLTDEALNNLLDNALKGIGVKNPKIRKPIRDQLRGAIYSGVGEAVDTVIDQAPIDSEAKDALKSTLRAAGQQDL